MIWTAAAIKLGADRLTVPAMLSAPGAASTDYELTIPYLTTTQG